MIGQRGKWCYKVNSTNEGGNETGQYDLKKMMAARGDAKTRWQGSLVRQEVRVDQRRLEKCPVFWNHTSLESWALLRSRLGSNGADATWPSDVKLEDFSAIRLSGRAYEIERNGARHGKAYIGLGFVWLLWRVGSLTLFCDSEACDGDVWSGYQ